MKTVSIRELQHEGVSKTIRAAQHEPVLIRKGDKPAAWIVSAEELARVAAPGQNNIYRGALQLIAVDLFDKGVLSMGQAARLAGLSLGEFFELCDRMQVPVLREPEGGIAAEVDTFERWLDSAQASTET